ncbi:MAG: acetate kinase [Candidatus Thiodiazotropha sp.]|jgi:acetate kinase
MRILVINAGSSSIKYRLFDMSDERFVATGLLERIGSPEAKFDHLTWHEGKESYGSGMRSVKDHRAALDWIVEVLTANGILFHGNGIDAIGHRVVHGGERFSSPVLIDAEVIEAIENLEPLAPLHNPANLIGIRVTTELAPNAPQIAVFDTAFHHSIPSYAYRYAIPTKIYHKHRVRRYGFHGTSHQFIAETAATWLDRPIESLRLITLHLGNGASAAAIEYGRCIDTSMGMTPLEGLVMGTRCGDIDPAICHYLVRQGWSWEETEQLLNQSSGLKGIAGCADLREIEARALQGDADAKLAVEIMTYRLRKYIGAYLAALGGLDALIFSGGIGEHSAMVRAATTERLDHLGIEIDNQRNISAKSNEISAIERPGSDTAILVIPTNEELSIARQTRDLLTKEFNISNHAT